MIRASNNPTECTPVRLSQSLGEFASLVALQTAHPTAAAGSYAVVNVTDGDDLVYYYSESDAAWFTHSSSSTAQGLNDVLSTNNESTTQDAIFRLDANKYIKIDRANQVIKIFDLTLHAVNPIAYWNGTQISFADGSGNVLDMSPSYFANNFSDGSLWQFTGALLNIGAGSGSVDLNPTALQFNADGSSTYYAKDKITVGAEDFPLPTGAGSPLATQSYVDNKVAGLLDLRGNYDASTNAFPSTGGSGTAGAILKGDFWYISVAGTLGGVAVNVGDSIYAKIDSPTSSDWEILEANLSYVPEDVANKTDTMAGNTASSTKYLSAKGVFDYIASVLVNATASVRGIVKLYTSTGSNTDGTMDQNSITNALALKENRPLVDIRTTSSTLTGTTTETQITSFNFEFPANTFADNDIMFFENLKFGKTGVLGSIAGRIRLSNTNNFATATQVARFTFSAGNIYYRPQRRFSFKGANLVGFNFNEPGVMNDITVSSLAEGSMALDRTQIIYGFISLTLSNGADSGVVNELQIYKR